MPCCFDPRSIRRRQDRSMERVALLRRGLALEGVTVGYNALEGIVAIAAGLVAGSVALTGFGIDSVIEVTSGVVLWWRLRAELGAARVGASTPHRRSARRDRRGDRAHGGLIDRDASPGPSEAARAGQSREPGA